MDGLAIQLDGLGICIMISFSGHPIDQFESHPNDMESDMVVKTPNLCGIHHTSQEANETLSEPRHFERLRGTKIRSTAIFPRFYRFMEAFS